MYDVSKLKRKRLEKYWTKKRLAVLAGVHPATVGRLEAGKHKDPDTIRKVADALGLDADELILDPTEPMPVGK
jgi:transcriptional regulator with XRE-family HTH domain